MSRADAKSLVIALTEMQKNSGPDHKTYAEIAQELAFKIGKPVTVRAVRYHLKKMEDAEPANRVVAPKGRPPRQGLHFVAQLAENLIRQTGMSETQLYSMLWTANGRLWLKVGKVSFHKLFASTRATRSGFIPPAHTERLMDTCCMALGQILLATNNPADHWLILWGIELHTRFIHIELVNLIDQALLKTQKLERGRIKGVEKKAGTLEWTDGEAKVILPESVWISFLEDAQKRLRLPICRVRLPAGYDVQLQSDSARNITLVDSAKAGFNMPSFEAATTQAKTAILRKLLTSIQNAHNNSESVHSAIEGMREEFARCNKKYANLIKPKSAWSTEQHLQKIYPDDAALHTFFADNPLSDTRHFNSKVKARRLPIKTSKKSTEPQPDAIPQAA